MKLIILNPYSILPLFASFLFFVLGVIVYSRREANKALTRIFLFNCFVTACWQCSWFVLFNTKDVELAIILINIGYTGISLIPISFFHFYISISNTQKYRFWVIVYYLFAFVFIFLLWYSKLFINEYYSYYWGFYPKAGQMHYLFILYLALVDLHCFRILYKFGKSINWFGEKGNQIKYLIFALIVYSFSAMDFLSNYGKEFYPLGVCFVLVYFLIQSFIIVRYRMMEVKIIVTKLGIFIGVYALVLGVPYWVGFKFKGFDFWVLPTTIAAFCCTIGPFIYLYLQKRAEDKILQEQRRYQSTLRQAATGMGRIKQLKKLLNLVVYVVTRAVHLEHTLIYLRDDKLKKYILSAFKSRKVEQIFLDSLPFDSYLVNQLRQQHAPLVLDDLSQKHKHLNSSQIKGIRDDIVSLSADLVLPIYIEDKLLAFIVFGRKESGKSFTEEDLSVFSSLTNQIALAIENAQFYEEVKRTQEQLFQAEKMATIGTMADGLSHQVNNRFHAMGFIAGDALDTISIIKTKGVPDELKETFDDLERAFTRVQENVVQGGEIVQGLLRYTRKGDAGLTEVDFSDVLKSAFEMAQFKIKTSDLKVMRDFPESMPKIKGNFTQLQEVFFNLIDNAYDAMMQRKSEKAELGFQPTLVIHTKPQGNYLEIIMEDNGIGVKDDDREKLFTPFFTTKLSSKKGTGLGLYVIRKIIEENHGGSVEMISRYMIGTKMKINLPIAIK